MKLQIKLLSINCMLRLGMDMEFLSFKPYWCIEYLFSKFRLKVCTWFCFRIRDTTCIVTNVYIIGRFVSNPLDLGIFQIWVKLQELIFGVIISLLSACWKIDGTLDSIFAFSRWFDPVITIWCIVDQSSFAWCNEGESNEFQLPHFF